MDLVLWYLVPPYCIMDFVPSYVVMVIVSSYHIDTEICLVCCNCQLVDILFFQLLLDTLHMCQVYTDFLKVTSRKLCTCLSMFTALIFVI